MGDIIWGIWGICLTKHVHYTLQTRTKMLTCYSWNCPGFQVVSIAWDHGSLDVDRFTLWIAPKALFQPVYFGHFQRGTELEELEGSAQAIFFGQAQEGTAVRGSAHIPARVEETAGRLRRNLQPNGLLDLRLYRGYRSCSFITSYYMPSVQGKGNEWYEKSQESCKKTWSSRSYLIGPYSAPWRLARSIDHRPLSCDLDQRQVMRGCHKHLKMFTGVLILH